MRNTLNGHWIGFDWDTSGAFRRQNRRRAHWSGPGIVNTGRNPFIHGHFQASQKSHAKPGSARR